MSNKTQLQTNNTALDALITRVNAAKDVAASLPEASGGAGEKVLCHTAIQLGITRGYQCIIFEEGMTWNDFFESNYAYAYDSDFNRFISLGDYLRGEIADDQGYPVFDTDLIKSNILYLG